MQRTKAAAAIRIEIELTDVARSTLENFAASDAQQTADPTNGRSALQAWEDGMGTHQRTIARSLRDLCFVLGGRPRRITTAAGGGAGGAGWLRVHLHGAAGRVVAEKQAVMSVGTGRQILALSEGIGLSVSLAALTAPCLYCGTPGSEVYCKGCDEGERRENEAGEPVHNLALRWSHGFGNAPRRAYERTPYDLADPVDLLRLDRIGRWKEMTGDQMDAMRVDLEWKVRALVRAKDEETTRELAAAREQGREEGERSLLDAITGVLGGHAWTRANVIQRFEALAKLAEGGPAASAERDELEERLGSECPECCGPLTFTGQCSQCQSAAECSQCGGDLDLHDECPKCFGPEIDDVQYFAEANGLSVPGEDDPALESREASDGLPLVDGYNLRRVSVYLRTITKDLIDKVNPARSVLDLLRRTSLLCQSLAGACEEHELTLRGALTLSDGLANRLRNEPTDEALDALGEGDS